ncbi:MAG: hypothetical protein D6692_09350 [Planctomycetota bacterium]|nr:MAG: hypothetical protein D6692_09350 [Planctomycetota bacterium]
MRTTLDAVTEILQRSGEDAPSALDPTGPSDVFDAETHLNRSRALILRQGPNPAGGWSFNTDYDFVTPFPTVQMTGTPGVPGFTVGEIVTGQTSGATGVVHQIDNPSGGTFVLNVGLLSGDAFTSGETIDGATSGESAPMTVAVDVITKSQMAMPDSPVALSWRPAEPNQFHAGAHELKRLALRGSLFYDTACKTFDFTEDIHIDRVFDVAFESIPESVQTYIVRHAAVEFQRFVRRDRNADLSNVAAMTEAKTIAYRHEGITSPSNMFATPSFGRLTRGRR